MKSQKLIYFICEHFLIFLVPGSTNTAHQPLQPDRLDCTLLLLDQEMNFSLSPGRHPGCVLCQVLGRYITSVTFIKGESKKGGWLWESTMYVRPDKFCALTYRTATPHFENLQYRRIPYNMIIKVTEFIKIDIVVCQSQPPFFDSPFNIWMIGLSERISRTTILMVVIEAVPLLLDKTVWPANIFKDFFCVNVQENCHCQNWHCCSSFSISWCNQTPITHRVKGTGGWYICNYSVYLGPDLLNLR